MDQILRFSLQFQLSKCSSISFSQCTQYIDQFEYGSIKIGFWGTFCGIFSVSKMIQLYWFERCSSGSRILRSQICPGLTKDNQLLYTATRNLCIIFLILIIFFNWSNLQILTSLAYKNRSRGFVIQLFS